MRFLEPDKWYQVTVTRDGGTGSYKLYVNNSLVTDNINATPLNITNRFNIGKSPASSANDDLTFGQIGTINIYERVLDLSEIGNLYELYGVQYLLKIASLIVEFLSLIL